jgi:hypothetical protein
MSALTRHRAKAELFVARNTAPDVKQLARTDDRRAASMFHPAEDLGPGRPLTADQILEQFGGEKFNATGRAAATDPPRGRGRPEIQQRGDDRTTAGALRAVWWFEDRGPQCSLLVFVDDATGRLMHLKFVETESALAYFAATREYLERHGKPVAFYSDKHGVFRVN